MDTMDTRRPGDILIFEAGDDWVGKSIAWLTKSNVSHSALLTDPNTMVEMGAKGIMENGFAADDAGERVYLLRPDPERDPAPVVKAARAYVDAGVQYDFPDLVILAGILIYRSIRPTQRWSKITDVVLNAACAQLDKLLNLLVHKGEKVPVMVCSQLVYQCYYDCGANYRIVLKDAPFQNALTRDMLAPETVCLANLRREGEANQVLTAVAPPLELDTESIAKELYEAMVETETAPAEDLMLDSVSLSGLAEPVSKFLDLVEKFLETSGVNLPVPALFVTPSDLLEHAANLKQYGTARITRRR